MSKKTLLLNNSYEVLSFIPLRKMIKLLYKDKVEVISTWEDFINWGSDKVKYPSILRLKNHIKRTFYNPRFSRKALIERDKSICQYCNKKLVASQITVDHILPRSHGGRSSFHNCVISCHPCNSKKANHTPDQVGMILLKKPTSPSFATYYIADFKEHWHTDWDIFLAQIR